MSIDMYILLLHLIVYNVRLAGSACVNRITSTESILFAKVFLN